MTPFANASITPPPPPLSPPLRLLLLLLRVVVVVVVGQKTKCGLSLRVMISAVPWTYIVQHQMAVIFITTRNMAKEANLMWI